MNHVWNVWKFNLNLLARLRWLRVCSHAVQTLIATLCLRLFLPFFGFHFARHIFYLRHQTPTWTDIFFLFSFYFQVRFTSNFADCTKLLRSPLFLIISLCYVFVRSSVRVQPRRQRCVCLLLRKLTPFRRRKSFIFSVVVLHPRTPATVRYSTIDFDYVFNAVEFHSVFTSKLSYVRLRGIEFQNSLSPMEITLRRFIVNKIMMLDRILTIFYVFILLRCMAGILRCVSSRFRLQLKLRLTARCSMKIYCFRFNQNARITSMSFIAVKY